jgi:hypothetical protein
MEQLFELPGYKDMGPEAKKQITTGIVELAGRTIVPGVVEGILDTLANNVTNAIDYIAGL